MERLTKVERAGLLAIAVVAGIVLLVEYVVSSIPPSAPTKEQRQQMEAFERSVRVYAADTVALPVKTSKKTKKAQRQLKRTAAAPNEKMERYERD